MHNSISKQKAGLLIINKDKVSKQHLRSNNIKDNGILFGHDIDYRKTMYPCQYKLYAKLHIKHIDAI